MHRHRLTALTLAGVLAISTATTTSIASDAVAQKLFDDAKALMTAKNFAEACPKLEQSQHIEPSEGTLFALGYCHENNGQLASAWLDYREGLASAKKSGNAKRIELATQGIARLEPRLSTLTITLPANAMGFTVTLDGKPFVASSAIPVDGGTHALRVTAEGKKPYDATVQVGVEKDAKVVAVPALAEAPKAADVSNSATGGEKKVPAVAYVLVAGGAVFTLGAIGARLAVTAAQDDRQAQCATQLATVCDDVGKSKVRTWEGISFVAGGLALASFGAAIYLYASTPSKEQPRPSAYVQLAPSLGGLQLQGAF